MRSCQRLTHQSKHDASLVEGSILTSCGIRIVELHTRRCAWSHVPTLTLGIQLLVPPALGHPRLRLRQA